MISPGSSPAVFVATFLWWCPLPGPHRCLPGKVPLPTIHRQHFQPHQQTATYGTASQRRSQSLISANKGLPPLRYLRYQKAVPC
ncbi:unnamed protein product [Acanthoscelides obtectus]|uniref:Uncharacterized protein n=1 Tax=Acanthoscelides obtectus TaxID=200917 RepID=A0A9P0MF45_ACAOB|nr:unnamed protein product [Acanthoscelides obtectus]CAK1647790.1 hypothetical protein AOBTE_LOCUS15397 [Acanthoscelides obtectus]